MSRPFTVSVSRSPRGALSSGSACLHGAAALSALNGEWQALCDATVGSTIFQTAHWLRVWCRAVGPLEGQSPIVIRVPAEGPMRLGLALQLCETEGDRRIAPLSSPWADYHDAIGAPANEADIDAAAVALLELAEETDAKIDCAEVRQGSLLHGILDRAGSRWQPSTPVCVIDLTEPEHLARICGRREHAIKRRRLRGLCDLRLAQARAPTEVIDAFPRFVELHQRQWSGRNDAVAPFTEPGVRPAFEAFARELSRVGMLDMTELKLDRKTIAAYFGFPYRGVYYAYRTAFDQDYLRFSPGHLMLQELLRSCAGEGFVAFDLMRGNYPYKAEYATRTAHNLAWRRPAP